MYSQWHDYACNTLYVHDSTAAFSTGSTSRATALTGELKSSSSSPASSTAAAVEQQGV